MDTLPEVGVKFTKYVRCILPMDGYLFWVKADILSASALINASAVNDWAINQGQKIVTPAATQNVKGSLHYTTASSQNEADSATTNRVVFTSEKEIEFLNEVGPSVLYIGEWEDLKFAFSTRDSYYQQAGIHHYAGTAVLSVLQSQLIEFPQQLDTRNVVVSNSLPLWLSMNGYINADWEFFGNDIPLFPSFLVPNNMPPLYGAVHIVPETTMALASAPYLDKTVSHYQLVTEKVRVTLFGTRNYNAQDFVDFVYQQSQNYEDFGIMNMPVVRDEKKTQVEIGALAMKKSIEFDINYYQTRMRDIARQLILEAVPAYYIQDYGAAALPLGEN